jgi:uncharacterized membrane protein YdfJ with MMPL/SSD domain
VASAVLFVVLFGLSMDYHVFILSRIREAVDGGMETDDAVRCGITRAAGVVTSAALVMVGVFSIFGTLSQLDVKEAGVDLATAILIDATVVRAVLLPASMNCSATGTGTSRAASSGSPKHITNHHHHTRSPSVHRRRPQPPERRRR